MSETNAFADMPSELLHYKLDTMLTPIIEIDGAEFSTLEGFFVHFRKRALLQAPWGSNLDAFNDVLRGGFGTPEGGFRLLWRNHQLSRQRLGWEETARHLRGRLLTCHPESVASVQSELARSLKGEGSTLFEVLVEIILAHGPGGQEAEDGVVLELL